MPDASYDVYKNLSSYKRLEELIGDGETENLYLECKAPSIPRLNKELQVHLAKSVSGFSNTTGGIVIYGISTTKHSHSGLDVLTQMEPLGNVQKFEQQIHRTIPTLSTPPILNFHTKTIKKKASDSKGVVVTHIPKNDGDPVQSAQDNLFYFRSGDDFTIAPFEMIKRLFSASESPDLRPLFLDHLAKVEPDGSYTIPIGIENKSSAIAEHTTISVIIQNTSACEKISLSSFRDQSEINPGSKIYIQHCSGVIHRGLDQILGDLKFKMKTIKGTKRRLDISFTLYANKMIARKIHYVAHITKNNFTVKKSSEETVY